MTDPTGEKSLTADDLNVLIEAVEAWESKDFASEMMGDMVEAMLIGKDPESRAEYEAKSKQRKDDYKRNQRQRKDRSILLRAKLIQLRDAMDVDAFTLSALRPAP